MNAVFGRPSVQNGPDADVSSADDLPVDQVNLVLAVQAGSPEIVYFYAYDCRGREHGQLPSVARRRLPDSVICG
jgi:hypothetical protein